MSDQTKRVSVNMPKTRDQKNLQLFLLLQDQELGILEKYPDDSIYPEMDEEGNINILTSSGVKYEIERILESLKKEIERNQTEEVASATQADSGQHGNTLSSKLDCNEVIIDGRPANMLDERESETSKSMDDNSWKNKFEANMLEITAKLDKLEKENADLNKTIETECNRVHDDVVTELLRHKWAIKENYSWIEDKVQFWAEQDCLCDEAQDESAGLSADAENAQINNQPSNQTISNKVTSNAHESARIGSNGSAGQKAEAGAKAYLVTNPGVLCYNCGNKGHYKDECTRKGKMCFRCKRYEGHVRADCPYSDNQLEKVLQENENQRRR